MKRSEFIKILEEKAIKYEIKDGIISILGNNVGYVDLRLLKSLPENVQFNNSGYVDLRSLESLPESTQFNNGGSIDLDSLKSLPESTQFNNGRAVFLTSLESLPESTFFNNRGDVYLKVGKLKAKPRSKINKEPIEDIPPIKTKRKPIQKLRIYKQQEV